MFLHTIWYPLHVPVSFAAYAFWLVAGVSAVYAIPAWYRNDPALQERSLLMTDLNRIGFIFFTLAMLFGGIWGYFAWGAYFMWDPKLHWAVILWLLLRQFAAHRQIAEIAALESAAVCRRHRDDPGGIHRHQLLLSIHSPVLTHV